LLSSKHGKVDCFLGGGDIGGLILQIASVLSLQSTAVNENVSGKFGTPVIATQRPSSTALVATFKFLKMPSVSGIWLNFSYHLLFVLGLLSNHTAKGKSVRKLKIEKF